MFGVVVVMLDDLIYDFFLVYWEIFEIISGGECILRFVYCIEVEVIGGLGIVFGKSGFLLLEGIWVLDFGIIIVGVGVLVVFVDLGVEVFKVEFFIYLDFFC